MSIKNTNKIDIFSQDKDGSYTLTIVVEKGEWGDKNAIQHLKEKLNNCIWYFLEEQYKKDFPECNRINEININVRSVDLFPAEAIEFLDEAALISAKYNSHITYRQL